MEGFSIRYIGLIVLSFLVGMMLQVMPLPDWAVWARPEWVFLILIFWVVSQPQRMGLVVAFVVGLVMDLLTGTLFGLHAFAYTFVLYLTSTLHPKLRFFPLWQQLGIIFLLTLLELALQCWVLEILGASPDSWGYWVPALTSIFIWPWFALLLKEGNEMVGGYR
ncbi:MAG: rod shape-determining protein MreD [Coxiellaceae bacterium]|nr:rod shape-determining protein MreD [Coxiellaceae bacterium]